MINFLNSVNFLHRKGQFSHTQKILRCFLPVRMRNCSPGKVVHFWKIEQLVSLIVFRRVLLNTLYLFATRYSSLGDYPMKTIFSGFRKKVLKY